MKKATTSASSFAPFFEKIEKLSRLQRIIVWAVTVTLLIAASGWFLIKPKYDQIDRLEQTLSQAQQELEKAKKNARELNDWRNKMKKKEAQYKTVMRALPEKEEIPSLIAGISQAGKDSGLEFLLFQPKPETAKGFYAEIPVDINVSGTYHQVALFFDKVSNLRRIVNIRDIKMTPATSQQQKSKGEMLLTTSCQAVTYKFIEGADQTKNTKSGAGKKK